MSINPMQKMRFCSVVVGSGALIMMGGVAVYYTQGMDFTAAGNSNVGTPTTTTPPTVPAIAKAAPSITGPAPLYAGEGPNSNPQAPIP